ncbi:Protein K10D6.2 c, partial [Aphelenchoides avenae]
MSGIAKQLCFHLQATNVLQIALLAVSMLLALVGLGLTVGGFISPAWQIVDIREFRAEHQHGLWWDCVRSSQSMAPIGDYFQESPLHCMYKFDDSAQRVVEASMAEIDWDAAAAESEKHRFL